MNKVYAVVIAILLVVCGMFYFQIRSKDKQIDKLNVENFTLNEKLQAQVKITNGKVQIVYKDKEKIRYQDKIVEKIIEKKVYLPPENKDTIITVDRDGKVDIIYDRYGFTFTPFVGLSYSGKFAPELGARFFYFDRWGTGLSASVHNIRWFIDYRIDFEWTKNTSVGVFTSSDKESGFVVHCFL